MKKAKLFQSAGCQAVRLPKELQFEGGYVYITEDLQRIFNAPNRPMAEMVLADTIQKY